MSHKAYEGTYQGEKAVWLQFGPYEAVVLPEIGGNLIAFRDTESGYRFLREPAESEMEQFKANPGVHGIPVLFPPNRYEDGKFPWNGKTYQFPVNEESTGNHLHGFLHTIPWRVEEFGSTASESYVTVSVKIDENHPVYRMLPHTFTFRLRYALSEDGLSQHVFIRNEGRESMPCLLAFHTAVNAPFAPGSTEADCKVKLTIGERWELDGRMLPTGKYQPLTAEEKQLQGEGVSPFFTSMDNHYTAVPQNGRNRMELTDSNIGKTLVYDVGASYKQWMIWNNGAAGKFFCPEPQINLVNAPNVKLPADEIGLFGLEPGEIWEETSRLYVRNNG
ncbi:MULTISPECIES: aldose 1-epimerase [Paenibacillus]|uniref:Aldose 1-epimerase n=1 Tax=Paenibacillus campinasensis TaxID=66347 RepID=A0ABW9T2I0_9BACL|nr:MULTISPECIES: aldose 1-epimerase [Paenibacillus]MUG66274.1 aldose 1-epimerase [Paenibacillus campinasensis]PAK54523.1 aldose epimerase [Paenibacillus sp. 7541]